MSRHDRRLPACLFCGDPVNPNQPGVYREVSGWEQQRIAGGANKITLAVRGDLYACRTCIDKKKSGININQDQLW